MHNSQDPQETTSNKICILALREERKEIAQEIKTTLATISQLNDELKLAHSLLSKLRAREEEIARIFAPSPEILPPGAPPQKRHKPTTGDLQNMIYDATHGDDDALVKVVVALLRDKKRDAKIENRLAPLRAAARAGKIQREKLGLKYSK